MLVLKDKTLFWFHMEFDGARIAKIHNLSQGGIRRQAIVWIFFGGLVILLHFVHLQLLLFLLGLKHLVEGVDAQVQVDFNTDQEGDAQNGRESFKDVFMVQQHFEALRDGGER